MICCNCHKSSIKIVVFLGAPGAGKGTVAQHLVNRYGMIHFSTGNLLRNEVESNTEMGKRIAAAVRGGALVSDDIVNGVVKDNLLKSSLAGELVLLDGYPRSTGQAEFMDSLDCGRMKNSIRVVEIDVDEDVVVERLSGRRVCEKCGATFGRLDNLDVCSSCGGVLIKRDDDQEEVVKYRLQEYRRLTFPLCEYYADRLSKVSGNASPREVAEAVGGIFDGFGLERR
ncbi:MAG: nucleoside monophosphate kinase [Holosporaceae bacterium]|jgi:adenylate kinase|nr:nucleoside monophosphate kinase [Holosporaceae bacterium]